MSSSREEGWLETKIGRAELWERMWVVFDDGVLYYSADRDADRDIDDNVAKVPMDRVISLRTDVSALYISESFQLRSILCKSTCQYEAHLLTKCILIFFNFLFTLFYRISMGIPQSKSLPRNINCILEQPLRMR